MLHIPYQWACQENIKLTARTPQVQKHRRMFNRDSPSPLQIFPGLQEGCFGWLAGWLVGWLLPRMVQAEQRISAVPTLHARCISWVQPANLFPQLMLILFIRAGAAQQISPLQLLRDDRWSWQYSYHTASDLWTVEFHISHSAFRWCLIVRGDLRMRTKSHFVNWPLLSP